MRDLFSILVQFASAVLVVLLLNVLGVVGVHYVRIVKNNPFKNVAEITRMDDKQIEFADGRKLKLPGGIDPDVKTEIQRSGNLVGLEVDQGYASLFVKSPQTNCQLGRPLFIIPLIPMDRPAYRARAVAFGSIDGN